MPAAALSPASRSLLAGDGPVGSASGSGGGVESAQLVQVGTMSFQSAWRHQFSFSDTQLLPFHLPSGPGPRVPMMYQMAEVATVSGRSPGRGGGGLCSKGCI